MGFMWHDPHLLKIGMLRQHFDGQTRGLHRAAFQASAADGLLGVGQQVAAFGFVLVIGQLGAASETPRVFSISPAGSKEGLPIVIKLLQDPLRDFAR